MTRYLITGGAGYVGTALLPLIAAEQGQVRRFFRGEKAPASAPGLAVEDFVGDVRSSDDLTRALAGIDVVLHLAAQTSVYVAEADPAADVEANVLPMLRLLEACRALGSKPTVVLASTATIYGVSPPLPVREDAPAAPVTVYDLHKLAAERYLAHYVQEGHVRGASLRLANVYGPGPKSSRPDRGVLNGMVRRALSGETLKIYGTGEFLRDYVYVDDVARAFLLAAARADALAGRAVPVASGDGHTFAQAIGLVARLVGERTSREVRVEHVEPPAGLSRIENRSFVADPRGLHASLGFVAEISLEQGIQRTIEYFTAQGAT